MGTWGTGIYANDIAEDVKDLCEEIFPFVEVEAGNRIVFAKFKDIVTAPIQDGECAAFWFALADWQWKHGILTQTIHSQAMALLEQNAGLADWQNDGSSADIKRRKQVLERLKLQLMQPMPERKIPKAKLAKPKHEAGDICIFHACTREEDPEDSLWSIPCLNNHYLFQDPAVAAGEEFLVPHFDGHGKYMAILCVGTEQVLHSEHLPGLYDEHSVYAFYDYLSFDKPTLPVLKACGFLPSLFFSLKDFNKKIHEKIGWTYVFSMAQSLTPNKAIFCDFEKIHDSEESSRFYALLDGKKYLSEADADFYDLNDVFRAFWESKVRMERVGITIDNLLDPNAVNPILLAPNEADLAYRKWVDSWR